MRGELGMLIKSIEIREYDNNNYEMTFHNTDGTFLHIVGDNDLKSLLREALKNIQRKI